jgi:CheY-like chemotaxis protein
MESEKRRKILLIDDDTSLLVTLSDFLRFEGYDVTTAESGELGLKRLKTVAPDLIILDMSMPGMGGIGFLKEISTPEGKPRYPVLVLTARANMAEFFANVEVDGFVAKPCDPGDLLMEVGRIIFLRSGSGEESDAAGVRARRKVLLAEDEDLIQACLSDAFAEAGYLVETVASGPEAIEKAVIQRPDAIVAKLILPNMNGDAVAAMLQQMPNTKDIPVVVYDAAGSESDVARVGGRKGVARFVADNAPQALIRSVCEVLE